jgi:hypothetical protein
MAPKSPTVVGDTSPAHASLETNKANSQIRSLIIAALVGLTVSIVGAAIEVMQKGRLEPIDPYYIFNPEILVAWIARLGVFPLLIHYVYRGGDCPKDWTAKFNLQWSWHNCLRFAHHIRRSHSRGCGYAEKGISFPRRWLRSRCLYEDYCPQVHHEYAGAPGIQERVRRNAK